MQTQTLTPQQLLVSRLIELPVEALYERVDQELTENVSLERDTEHETFADEAPYENTTADTELNDTTADYSTPDDIPDNLPAARQANTEAVTGETQSFYDQLEEQIGFFHLTPHEQEIIRYLIGSLDDDGLLRVPLSRLQDELEVYHNVNTTPEELEHILHVLQNFDPPGVGARTLQECLLLQARHTSDHPSPVKEKLVTLLRTQFDNLMLRRWDRIQRAMKLTDTDVSRLQHEVRRLNPRPGSSMGEAVGRNLQQITPDFIVDTDPGGHLSFTLSDGRVPPLRVNSGDLTLLQTYETRDARQLSRAERDALLYLRDRTGKAQSFIEALQQRHHTLTTTMKAILHLQRPFFESGDETLLRPMTLEDVARHTQLHPSTISRVSNAKWVQTPYGTYPLRWFFTSAAHLDGSEVSIRNIQAALREIVQGEDKRNPLSDQDIAEALHHRGYDVARRTVAKYREQLRIPVARLRRSLKV